jgi:hypothetical protein
MSTEQVRPAIVDITAIFGTITADQRLFKERENSYK